MLYWVKKSVQSSGQRKTMQYIKQEFTYSGGGSKRFGLCCAMKLWAPPCMLRRVGLHGPGWGRRKCSQVLVIYDERDIRSCTPRYTESGCFRCTGESPSGNWWAFSDDTYFPPYWLLSGRCATRAGLMRRYIIAANCMRGAEVSGEVWLQYSY